MLAYVVGVVAARIAALLCVVTIALPYLVRRNRLSRLGLAQDRSAPYLKRLWPHFWTGYTILGLSTLHAGTVTGGMRHANTVGVWAATVAFFLLVYEIAVGLALKDQRVSRRSLIRLHFWIMLAFAAALVLHLAMNAS